MLRQSALGSGPGQRVLVGPPPTAWLYTDFRARSTARCGERREGATTGGGRVRVPTFARESSNLIECGDRVRRSCAAAQPSTPPLPRPHTRLHSSHAPCPCSRRCWRPPVGSRKRPARPGGSDRRGPGPREQRGTSPVPARHAGTARRCPPRPACPCSLAPPPAAPPCRPPPRFTRRPQTPCQPRPVCAAAAPLHHSSISPSTANSRMQTRESLRTRVCERV